MAGGDGSPAVALGAGGPPAPLTDREAELLTATLEVLHDTGYDRLTVEKVVARAHASKATVYRRWPTKADLVVAAFIHGVRHVVHVSDTGSLRGDLLELGTLMLRQLEFSGNAIGGVLPELRRSPKLRAVFEDEFFRERRDIVHGILRRAVDRGEIRPEVISNEIWDVFPGYLVFRAMVPGHPPTRTTLLALVDEVILPSLRRQP